MSNINLTKKLSLSQDFSTRALGSPWGPEWFSGSHEQRPLLNSSAVILQNPIDEQTATSVESLWKGPTNHERLRTALSEIHHLKQIYNCSTILSLFEQICLIDKNIHRTLPCHNFWMSIIKYLCNQIMQSTIWPTWRKNISNGYDFMKCALMNRVDLKQHWAKLNVPKLFQPRTTCTLFYFKVQG